MFEEALEDYERASKIAPLNPKYHHAKGITYEALAAKVEKEHGKFKRFDLEVLPIENRFAEELIAYIRDDYLKFCNQAIGMYLQAVEVDENFNQSRFHLGRV
jgi:tetratricopeptide (TPR) repeat protein